MCCDSGDAPFNISNAVELLSKRQFEIQPEQLAIRNSTENCLLPIITSISNCLPYPCVIAFLMLPNHQTLPGHVNIFLQ